MDTGTVIFIIFSWLSLFAVGYFFRKKEMKLRVGSLLLFTEWFNGKKQSRGKILAIDQLPHQKVYGVRIELWQEAHGGFF